MKVVKGFMAHVGIAGRDYDSKTNNKAYNITAHLNLSCLREPYNTECGTTKIFNGISQDNKDHRNSDILRELIPENEPYTLSLRIDKDNDVPQLMINDSGTWTDFISGDDRIGLTNGPWFPYMEIQFDTDISEHKVTRFLPKEVESSLPDELTETPTEGNEEDSLPVDENREDSLPDSPIDGNSEGLPTNLTESDTKKN